MLILSRFHTFFTKFFPFSSPLLHFNPDDCIFGHRKAAAFFWKHGSFSIIQQQKGKFDFHKEGQRQRQVPEARPAPHGLDLPAQLLSSRLLASQIIPFLLVQCNSIPKYSTYNCFFIVSRHCDGKNPVAWEFHRVFAHRSKSDGFYLPSSSRSMISRASGACLSIFSGKPK